VLLGFTPVTSGQALVNGIDVATRPDDARRAIGYVPELVALYPLLSGIENLQFFCDLAGHRYTADELERFLADVGLDASTASRRVSTYSKGMRQKVGIAIALAKHADVFLLDEPTSGLDPASANEFGTIVASLAGRGGAVLVTTHDLFRARSSAARIGIMHNGRLLVELERGELDATELERAYLRHVEPR
jgi:ABC-2 type transport system ATP-binding protein